jgi:hypothetical protein
MALEDTSRVEAAMDASLEPGLKNSLPPITKGPKQKASHEPTYDAHPKVAGECRHTVENASRHQWRSLRPRALRCYDARRASRRRAFPIAFNLAGPLQWPLGPRSVGEPSKVHCRELITDRFDENDLSKGNARAGFPDGRCDVRPLVIEHRHVNDTPH